MNKLFYVSHADDTLWDMNDFARYLGCYSDNFCEDDLFITIDDEGNLFVYYNPTGDNWYIDHVEDEDIIIDIDPNFRKKRYDEI